MVEPVLGLALVMGFRVGPFFPRLGDPGEAESLTGKFLNPALGARRSIAELLLFPFLGDTPAMLYCPYGFVSELRMVVPMGIYKPPRGFTAFSNVSVLPLRCTR